MSSKWQRRACAGLATAGGPAAAGCEVFEPALQTRVPGFTLGTIAQIRRHPTPDADEKRAIVKSLLGLGDDLQSNLTVDVFFNLRIP